MAPDWYGADYFDRDYDDDLDEVAASVSADGHPRRYGIQPRDAYTKALAQQQLGKGALIPPDAGTFPGTDFEAELIRLQMPQEFSRDWTITWNVEFALAEVRTGSFEPVRPQIGQSFLRIRWGSGGASNEAEVDVRSGGQVTLFGAFVEVVVVGQEVPGVNSAQPDAVGGTVSATIAPGSPSGGLNQATRTVVLGDIEPQKIIRSAIPRRAMYVTHLISQPDSDFGRELRFIGGVTGRVGSYFYLDQDELSRPTYGPVIMVPAAAQFCDFRNQEPALGVTFLDVSLIYTLAM